MGHDVSELVINIAGMCSSLQCQRGLSDKTALRWISPSLESTDYSFAELDRQSNKVANALQTVGLHSGTRVAIFLPKTSEVFFCLLGILKANGIACPLFSNFGEDALLDRLGDSSTQVIITKKGLLRKILPIWDRLPDLKAVLLIDAEQDQDDRILSYPLLMDKASDQFEPPVTSPDTPSLLHYTSGSTGKPKGVLHRHGAYKTILQTGQEVLKIKPDDIYWCTADQAWITGTSYGVFAPWLIGATQVHFGGGFQADVWCRILEKYKVTRWFTAPTALRMMIQQEDLIQRKYDYSALQNIFSVGEPLNPEIIYWGRRFFRMDIHDTWFQTETGAIMIANRPGLTVRPGSMGKPIDGIHPAIISDEGKLLEAGEQGNLCLSPGWESMFSEYWKNPTAYKNKFKNNYYYTGDMAYQDKDGYFWFVGRTDDVINTAGHLVSPFEVESALLELAEVSDAGVIAAPDEMLFECVVAYIRLKPGIEWSRDLELKIMRYISNRVSSNACPKEIKVVDSIPKNKSGKIMRRLLKAWYTGQDAGDISTMEEN
jgi:acetyl-CoA synthetase